MSVQKGTQTRRAARPRSARQTQPAASKPAARSAGAAGLAEQAAAVTSGWAPTVARILLGLVLAWFGYHELVQPALWTGYVPVVDSRSAAATLLVLAHGWVLLMLAVVLGAGILPRVAAATASVLLLQIVISLSVTGGVTDLTMRDVGVLGLAVCLTARTEQRLTLSR